MLDNYTLSGEIKVENCEQDESDQGNLRQVK